MLSQTGGTFKNIENIGRCPDDEPPYSHKIEMQNTKKLITL